MLTEEWAKTCTDHRKVYLKNNVENVNFTHMKRNGNKYGEMEMKLQLRHLSSFHRWPKFKR